MFWRLTPRELLLIAGLGLPGPGHCDQAALARLMTEYPDDGG